MSWTQRQRDTVRSRRAILLALLALQLLSADALRWHLTTATLKTEVDYLLGHAVVVAENWRREGAFARHFVPSRSIDASLPEWTYRDDYWRDYLSQPPLSYALQYGAMRMFPGADPVVVGKLLAQVQIAIGVLLAGVLLVDVFGFAATLAGLSCLVWGRPFLLWFVDGYYSTTPAMVCLLLITAWSLLFYKRVLAAGATAQARTSDYAIAGLIAYIGVLSEWIALFGCAVATLAFAAIAVPFLRQWSSRARQALAFSAAIAGGCAAALLTIVVLYGTKVGFAFFWRQLLSRVEERTGAGMFGYLEYTGILVKQMQTSWPGAMLLVLVAMTLAVVAYAVAIVSVPGSQRPHLGARADGQLLLLAIVLGFGGPLAYCYRLQDLVAIHWWFSGTWAVGWTMTVCAFTYAVRSLIHRIGLMAVRRPLDFAFCVSLLAAVIGWNLQFAELTAKEGASAEGTVVTPAINASRELYRAMGGALPRDGVPLVVADMPHLFNDYPYATAYLRRPVVRMDASGTLLKLGSSEDALPALVARGGDVYMAYDRSLRACSHPDATSARWRMVTTLAFCRVPVSVLAKPPGRVFAGSPAEQADVFGRWIGGVVHHECCEGRQLLNVTRLVDSRLRVRSGEAVDAARLSTADPFQTLIRKWQERFAGKVVHARLTDVFVTGIVADADRWYLLAVNGVDGNGLPDFHDGITVEANGRALDVLTPYQVKTTDGTALLPLSLIVVRAPTDLPRDNLTIEILERGAALARTAHVAVAEWGDEDAMRRVERDALIALSTGCAGPPGAPAALRTQPAPAGSVRLRWNGAAGGPEAYVLHGGTAPGATDVTQSELGDTATTFEATRVPQGTYYLRVRGRNACGVGAASNEVVAVVP
jgi:hypothetical protein